MNYKIGQVSKILNIPIETLRYYEQLNIVYPNKNDNKYRLYEPWDINFISECKRLRSLDYSLSEIHNIMHCDNLEQYSKRVEEKQMDYIRKLKHYSLLIKKNEEFRNNLLNIEKDLGEFSLTEQQDLYYMLHRYNYNYEPIDESWLNYLPFAEITVEMQMNNILNRDTTNDHAWGYSIKKEYVEALDIPLNDKVKCVRKKKCVTTIITAGEKGSFSLKLLDKALEYIRENGYQLTGNVTGNILARVHESDRYHRYIKVWLPIE
ncbi:MerR family transcriptional regulator [Paenibacillus sp. FSL E2-0178]|uniref:MerR family transcriptional regulator n=1 Tax=Paenibacillus sp. FSL E2-0178 TaxID=2921361 RepID=UPI003158B6AC